MSDMEAMSAHDDMGHDMDQASGRNTPSNALQEYVHREIPCKKKVTCTNDTVLAVDAYFKQHPDLAKYYEYTCEFE